MSYIGAAISEAILRGGRARSFGLPSACAPADHACSRCAPFGRDGPLAAQTVVLQDDFEDWRDADGVRFPFKMRRAAEGNTTEEWTVSKIKVNPRIDPRKFAVESGS